MPALKLSHKILLAASVVVISVFALFALYNDYRQRDDIRDSLENHFHAMGQALADNIQNWLSGRLLLVQGSAQSIALDPSNARTLQVLEEPIMAATFVAGYMAHADGRFDIRPARVMPTGFDARQRPWYQEALSKDGPVLTEPYIGAGTDYLVMTQAVPVKVGTQLLGALGVNLNLDEMARIINTQDFDGLGYAFLLSADGRILVHPDKKQVTQNLTDLFPQGAPPIADSFSEVELAGQQRILTFVPRSRPSKSRR